jgi:purine-binding chemotaxis protein CheW
MPQLQPPRGAQPVQYLSFVLGTEVFAIGVLGIKEIIEYTAITDVPMMPAYLRGVINLRGVVVPVADLSVRFGRPSSPVTKRTCIIIIETQISGERQEIGVLVDAVNAVLDIAPANIQPPPAFGTGLRIDFIHGMVEIDARFVILLEVSRILAFEYMQQLADADAVR